MPKIDAYLGTMSDAEKQKVDNVLQIVEDIGAQLSGIDPNMLGAIFMELVGRWIGGYYAKNDVAAGRKMRKEIFETFCNCTQMVFEKRAREAGR